jgi:hypothetical protein
MSVASLRKDWSVFSVKLAQTIKHKAKLSCAQPVMALAFMVDQRFIK